MTLQIDRFKSLTALITEKNNLHRKHGEWTARQEELSSFYNGQPIMTEEDADDENLEEITNHLIGYSNMQTIETRIYSMWSTSNKLIDVNVVDEDMDAIERERASEWINKYLNKAIYKSTRFGAFWRSVSGAIAMSGRVACIHREDSDWCPTVQTKIYLPDSVGTDASELTYAFAPREFTYAQLETMLDATGSEEEGDDEEVEMENEVEINEDIVRQLMETIDAQVERTDSPLNTGTENEELSQDNADSFESSNRTTVNLWAYYEVRFDEELESKVVDLLIFTDEFRNSEGDGEDTTTHEIVAFYPAFYKHPSEWMHLIVSDASIGGSKRFSTAKGIAEITFNSDIDSEELLNRIFSGEKMRAIPRFQQGPETDEDKLLGWNPEESTLVPDSLKEFRFQGSTGGLQNPLSLLRQNASSQSGSAHSNSGRDEQLRVQAVAHRSDAKATSGSQVSDIHKSMKIVASEIVRRFFVGDTDGGSPGYEDIMWFRAQMKKRGVKLKRLASMIFGYYENIEVEIVKSSSSGEADHDVAVAQQLMQNLGNYPASVRPFIVRRYTTMITGDPDFSDQLIDLLPKINSAQRVTAESEFEQIARDASVGEETPLGADDVHVEHGKTHNKHLRIIVARSNLRAWNREDAAHFTGMQIHQQLHIDELLLNDTTRSEGEFILAEFQQVVADGDKLLDEVTRNELEEQGLSDKQIEIQLKVAEGERKQRELAMKEANTASVIEQRRERQKDVRRKGDQQFIIQKNQLEQKNN